MRTPSICVILNPSSGKDDDPAATEALLARIESDPRAVLRRLDRPGDLDRVVAEAVREGFETIVAGGGDGTIAGVAGGLVGTGVTMGILPMGTFNFMARSLDLPQDRDAALTVAMEGRAAPLTVGEVNGKVFLNNASLGAYAAVLDVREGVYRRWGRSRIAAYWSVLKAMLTIYRPLDMKVTVDGQSRHVRTPMAFVASSAYQLDQYALDGADAIRAGKLALILPPDVNRLQLLWRAIKILFGGMHRGQDYQLVTGRDIEIETRRSNALVARDGERARMRGPYRFTVRENALMVRVPDAGAAAAETPREGAA